MGREVVAKPLPRWSEVGISRGKITGYLLATGHPVGGAKARYFESRGYSIDSPEVLEESLTDVALRGEVVSEEATEWGTKYVVVGTVQAPDGNPMSLATVWIDVDEPVPMLVTAYPARDK